MRGSMHSGAASICAVCAACSVLLLSCERSSRQAVVRGPALADTNQALAVPAKTGRVTAPDSVLDRMRVDARLYRNPEQTALRITDVTVYNPTNHRATALALRVTFTNAAGRSIGMCDVPFPGFVIAGGSTTEPFINLPSEEHSNSWKYLMANATGVIVHVVQATFI